MLCSRREAMEWAARLASLSVFKERSCQTHAILNANYKKFSKEGRKDAAEGFV